MAVPAAVLATVVAGLAILATLDVDVQTISAVELAGREDDARAFFIADYGFVALYAILIPLAILRFRRAVAGGIWMAVAAADLFVAGIVDAVENTLLLSAATDGPAAGRVDAAHALAIPKVALFVLGAIGALLIAYRSARSSA